MEVRDRYLARAHGDPVVAAAELARGLMEGDPARFKVGYSAENAAIAAAELFALDRSQSAQLCLALDAVWERVVAALDRD